MATQDFLSLLNRQIQKETGRINGPGTGVSDSIPTVIQGKNPQKALLSDGEYVIKADIVSNLGGGSTNPGFEFFDKFMELVGKMDRETAANFAQAVLIQAEVAIDTQPEISDTK